MSTASTTIISITDTIYYDLLTQSGIRRRLERRYNAKIIPRIIVVATGLLCYVLSVFVSSIGETIINLAFANFGVCGGPFLGLILCAFLDKKFKPPSNIVIRSTVIALIISAIGGFGSVLGLTIPGVIISPLWWTPVGCTINVALCMAAKVCTKELDNNENLIMK